MAEVFEKAKVWEQDVAIPTYPVGVPDKNPMFLEKRVYQGSSGKVYPHSVIDKIYDEKIEKTYRAVFLENKYLKIMFLPELGGRVQRATDKTNGYDFVYYNQVIKPALVGLAGPWISGGIEFNWPQHHRPSTFDPLDYAIEEHPDGSKILSAPTRLLWKWTGPPCAGTRANPPIHCWAQFMILSIRGHAGNWPKTGFLNPNWVWCQRLMEEFYL